jgi:DNA-binding response OmpR family regulator
LARFRARHILHRAPTWGLSKHGLQSRLYDAFTSRGVIYLRVYVGQLRQKIEAKPDDPRVIMPEPGIGYRVADSSI